MHILRFLIILLMIMLNLPVFSQSQIQADFPSVQVLTSEFLYEKASFPQCHASTIVETEDGLLVAFYGGTHERYPDVCIYLSRLIDGKWTAPEKVADGIINDRLRYPTWNPVLFYNKNHLYLYYKVGPSPVQWWGMVKESSDYGNSWSEAQKMPDDILGPIRNKPVVLPSGTILSPSSIEYSPELWKSHIERSTDNGKSWTKINIHSPDSVKIIQPTILVHPDGGIQALLRSNQDVVMQSWSYDDGLSWSEPARTDIPHPNSGIDAIVTDSGWYLLVNNPLRSGNSWEVGRNRLDLYISSDGQSWQDIYSLENEKQGKFSYPAIIQTKDGIIHITFTHNRTKIKHVSLILTNE